MKRQCKTGQDKTRQEVDTDIKEQLKSALKKAHRADLADLIESAPEQN